MSIENYLKVAVYRQKKEMSEERAIIVLTWSMMPAGIVRDVVVLRCRLWYVGTMVVGLYGWVRLINGERAYKGQIDKRRKRVNYSANGSRAFDYDQYFFFQP